MADIRLRPQLLRGSSAVEYAIVMACLTLILSTAALMGDSANETLVSAANSLFERSHIRGEPVYDGGGTDANTEPPEDLASTIVE